VVYFKVPSPYLPGYTEENHKNVKIVDVRFESRNRYFNWLSVVGVPATIRTLHIPVTCQSINV
jgi:hypothetical protein